MAYRKNSPRRAYSSKRLVAIGSIISRTHGSFMPFLAVSVIFMLGTLGISLDLMRDFETVHQLEFAAQSAALYGLAKIGISYSAANAQTNVTSAIIAANSFNWNSAQCGPENNIWTKPVTFARSDIQFPKNPDDPNEFFVQVTARRQNNEALQQFFLPLLYTGLSKAGLPSQVTTFHTYSTIAVIGQPASRIGAGAPQSLQSDPILGDMVGAAALPLAISYRQFAILTNPGQTSTTYTLDLVASTASEYGGSAPPGHIKACFVNVAGTGNGSNYYGSGQGNLAIDQLEGLFSYFLGTNPPQLIAPAAIERGSQLSAFDPADPTFVLRQAEIFQAFSQLAAAKPNSFFIVPVLSSDPSFSNNNTVVGFARLRLTPINLSGATIPSITINIGESLPARNTSSATGFSSIPGNTSNLIPPPPFTPGQFNPFMPRQFDPSLNGVTVRPRGIILSPAISPWQSNAS